jgi:hypothetical protein
MDLRPTLAAMREPGMIIYLSHGRSTGPDREAAQLAPISGLLRG